MGESKRNPCWSSLSHNSCWQKSPGRDSTPSEGSLGREVRGPSRLFTPSLHVRCGVFCRRQKLEDVFSPSRRNVSGTLTVELQRPGDDFIPSEHPLGEESHMKQRAGAGRYLPGPGVAASGSIGGSFLFFIATVIREGSDFLRLIYLSLCIQHVAPQRFTRRCGLIHCLGCFFVFQCCWSENVKVIWVDFSRSFATGICLWNIPRSISKRLAAQTMQTGMMLHAMMSSARLMSAFCLLFWIQIPSRDFFCMYLPLTCQAL